MTERLQLEATYPHPPERVWKAITDPEAMSAWLMPTNFKPLIGYRFRMERLDAAAITGKVIEVDEGKILAYTWDDGEAGEGSKVIWTLEPVDGGTRVRLEQVAIEAPVVNVIATESYFNWLYALRHGLPGLLRILAAHDRTPKPPIVYVLEGATR
jgi:uncharacterized protein YndB with AHSA1/START domain